MIAGTPVLIYSIKADTSSGLRNPAVYDLTSTPAQKIKNLCMHRIILQIIFVICFTVMFE
jgi:hypothetical protein